MIPWQTGCYYTYIKYTTLIVSSISVASSVHSSSPVIRQDQLVLVGRCCARHVRVLFKRGSSTLALACSTDYQEKSNHDSGPGKRRSESTS